MNAFALRQGVLHAESVSLAAIAERYGTPCYVYSRSALESAYRQFSQACRGRDALVCYAVKANSNLAVLDSLRRLGAGFDIVSGGELERVLAAGGEAGKTVFSGVGKSAEEMRRALSAGIFCFNVESEPELHRLAGIAASMEQRASVSLRVNPDIDPNTHPYIATGLAQNKFGVSLEEALPLYRAANRMKSLRVVGMDVHIGSQITELAPFLAAVDKALKFIDALTAEGISLTHLDMGGGLGIRYDTESPPPVREYIDALLARIGTRRLKLILEPGRSLIGNAGVLLTRVEYLKQGAKNFAVVDAAMNDLMRPALYEAWHAVAPVLPRPGTARQYDIVGPVCESSDWLARDRSLCVEPGDLLAVLSAGAYGMSMSSNYNTRPRAAEVMVEGERAWLVREREPIGSLFALEHRLPE